MLLQSRACSILASTDNEQSQSVQILLVSGIEREDCKASGNVWLHERCALFLLLREGLGLSVRSSEFQVYKTRIFGRDTPRLPIEPLAVVEDIEQVTREI